MMIKSKLSIISAIVLLTACTSPNKKCPKATQATEELAPEFKIGEHDDQATINMNSYDETQYWKGNMNARLSKIKQIYEKADWTDAQHKTHFFQNLDDSQKAFEDYLKAQVELQYPKAEEDEWWASGIPPSINMIYTKHYKSRYMELELWEKGTPNGEVCGGSALTQYELEEMKKVMSFNEKINKSN